MTLMDLAKARTTIPHAERTTREASGNYRSYKGAGSLKPAVYGRGLLF